MLRPRPTRWLLLALIAVLGLMLAFAAACDDEEDGGEEPTATTPAETPAGETPAAGEIPELDVTAADFSFDAPASIAGGLTRIVLTNTSNAEDHHVQLFRFNEGVTFDQFTQALQADETGAQALALGVLGGGANTITPGGTSSVINDLEAGTYALICFVSGADGVPHLAKGMIEPLEVTEAPAEQPEPPAADATFTLADFSFTGPETLAAGPTTLEIDNSGLQPHEMTLLKADQGVTFDQILELLQSEEEPAGPPPVTSAGGAGAIAPGETAYAELDLQAGLYVMLCFVPDETGTAHAELGMVDSFTVE